MSCKGFKILSLMQRWGSKREMMGDDPPYLAVGTEVSAKYKGAFCEAKVRKIVRSVKCKIAFKLGLGTATVTDDQIKGTLRAGSVVEVKHPDKKELVEATIIKIQDCSQYTVVFDDGDITTLRRTALCLKSGRHFAESETLDQLPLTHPEHFGNPVIGGRRGRRNRQDDSSDDDDSSKKGKQPKEEKEADIGKVVCVEISEKKKQKDNWFPGLVVAPTAQDTVKINVKEDYLVRSFKDGRYYTVPKKEATPFTREIGLKVDNNTLKIAVDKALLFMDRDELPPHWDRELLFGLNDGSDSDSDAAFDSDTSDDEPREEKDHFVAQLYKFMDDRGTPINKGPTINGRDVDLYKLFKVVHKLGGCNRVTNHNQWKTVSHKLGFGQNPTSVNLVKHAYKKFLHSFEDFYRKLGCTMVNHPRGQRARHRGSNRSLIRDKDKALPTKDKIGDKDGEDSRDELPMEQEKKEKEILPKEEPKPKEPIPEPLLKPMRETRKEVQKPKSEKVEKKEDVKVLPATSKVIDLPVKSIVVKGDDKIKSDDREERIKMREMARADVVSKDDLKPDKENTKNIKDPAKTEENQRVGKVTRREVKENKKEDKEEDKSKGAAEREGRVKKNITPTAVEPSTSTDENKTKKSRSLFSKMTGSKRPKEMSDKVPRANKTQIGVQSVRQKRTFSERMKAMVKKLKMKTGGKHLRHKSPAAVDSKESGDKKKPLPEEPPKVVVPQLTRSKSKEEMISKTRKSETPAEKKTPIPPLQPNNPEKKPSSTKKKKDDDKSTSNEEILDLLPNYKSIATGDKLKVYYGPTHESKVTYEAKVLSLKEEENDTVYLVHYTGWNTRYDEWIRRNRIADNLSWSPGRAKRTRQPPTSQGSQPRVGKRSKSRSGEVRSTTPSSVTSSSSRTKSPAVSGPGQRNVRSRQRTRRVSGHTHTDFSESEDEDNYESDDMENVQLLVEQRLNKENKEDKETKDSKELLMDRMRSRGSYRRRVESSCESEEPNSEPQENKNKKIKEENEEDRTRSRSEKKKTDDANKLNSPPVDENKKDVGTEVLRSDRLRNKRKLAEEKADSGDEKEVKPEIKMEEVKSQKVVGEDKRKSDVKSTGESEKSITLSEVEGKRKLKRKSDEVVIEEEAKSNERRRSKRVTPRKEESKSKDDENQSEGQEVDQPKLESKVAIKDELDTIDDKEIAIKEEDCEIEVDEEEEEFESSSRFDTVPEDIYEFKEPEPFEFEVRSKCGEEKGGKQRRTFGRMSDEPTSPASVRKKLTRMKSESPTSFENKRSVKKSLIKMEEEDKEEINLASDAKKEAEEDSRKSPRPVSPKDKRQDTSTRPKGVSKDGEEVFQPLSLFSDLPLEGAGDEDSNDRLVISEPETEGESQEPLFSHQQRDHEDFFPTCITQSTSVENSVSKSPFSGFAEKLKEGVQKVEEEVQPKKRKTEEEEEDDPIMSAIQRVFAQSSNEDEDSNDIDLLSEMPDPVDKKENVISIDKTTDSNTESVKSIDSQTVENTDSQLSLSNHSEENDVTITDPIEINSEKIIEEINLASTDSETEEVPEIEELRNDEEDNTIDMVELSNETTKKDEPQDNDSKNGEEGKDVSEENDENNTEEVKEDEAQLIEDSVSLNSSAEGKVDRETASGSRSTSEVDSEDNNEKQEEERDEVEEEVELDEEVVIETIEEKRDSGEDNDDEEPTVVEERADEIIVEEPMEQESKEEAVKEEADKEEVCEAEEGNLESLLCEETIPGSPAPSSSVAVENTLPSSPELPFASVPVTYKPPPPQAKLPLPPPPPPPPPAPAPAPVAPSPANEAAPVMENTPPTTPESSLSPISNSPRGERSGSSPVPENESSKSNRDSSEVDMEHFPPSTKPSNFSEEDTNSGAANINPNPKKTSTTEESEAQSIRKRRRSHKRSDDNTKRIKLSHRSPRHNTGSESDDDTSENSLDLMSLHSRSPRPSKYNFFVQLDPDLDVSQRIDVLQQKLAELRKTYMSVKAELAGIDRRRKKLRRRERDATVKGSVKTEVTCS